MGDKARILWHKIKLKMALKTRQAFAIPNLFGLHIFFAQKNGYDVLAFDGVADELNSEQFIEKLVDEKPDVIFMECSTPSFEQDISNGLKLKRKRI